MRPAAAVVLCGGASSRMGRDKASLPFGPETLLERVIRLVRSVVDEVVLAAGADQILPPGLPVVRDAGEGRGPLPALLSASAAVHGDHVFLVACDTPLLQPPLVRLLLDQARGWDACVPLIDGGTVRLPRLIGQSRAMDLILTSRSVGAREALQMG